jgi:ATP-dependent Lon protease
MENPANVLPFEGVDPDLIMKELLNLKNNPNHPTKNGKELWSSYITTKWAKLEVNQKARRVVVFWEENITKAAREYILEEVRKLIGKEINVEKERQAATTKHDFARIIHLRVDPAAAADWKSRVSN